MDVPIAANVLGTLGAICWSVQVRTASERLEGLESSQDQLIPQIVINYRRHNTIGLQPSMMMLWAWAGVPLGVYNIVQSFNIALRIQPQILTTLSLVTWIQCYYYEKNWTIPKALSVVIPIAAVMGGIQAALIVALRIGRHRAVEWPVQLMGGLSAALLAAGVLTHYWDIYKHRTVRGISFLFVFIDAMGDLTSLISVFFQPSLDVLGLVVYGTELALWCGVFACGGYFNLVPWIKSRARAKREATLSCRGSGSGEEMEATHEESCTNAVALHETPSSSSVFRTTSGGMRGRTAHAQQSHTVTEMG